MKKVLSAVIFSAVLTACSNAQTTEPNAPMIGGNQDSHGCLSAAGQSYSFMKQECVQVFNVAEIKLADPANDTLAVYGILSVDKQQVEVFAADLPENTILSAVKGGYASKDGKILLMKTAKGWKIQK